MFLLFCDSQHMNKDPAKHVLALEKEIQFLVEFQ